MTKTARSLAVAAGAFIFVVFLNISSPPLKMAENWLGDLRIVLFGAPSSGQAADRIVIVSITENTLSVLPYRTPVDRGFLSNVVSDLEKKQVDAIGVDLLFDQPTEQDKDRVLFTALRESKVPVVTAFAERQDGLSDAQVVYMAEALQGIQHGLAVVAKDSDDVVRWALLRRRGENGAVRLGFAARLAAELGMALPEGDETRIVFRRNAGSATPVFKSYEAQLLQLLPRDWFEGKVVLVGVDLPLDDRHPTPVSNVLPSVPRMPGVFIHAHVLAQLLGNKAIHVPDTLRFHSLVLVCCLFGATLFASGIGVAFKVVWAALALTVAWAGAFIVFNKWALLIPLVAPSLGFILSAGTEALLGWRIDQRQRRFIREAFSKFLSPDVVEQLEREPGRLSLNGEKREMTFLFSDIAGFTTLTEKTDPRILVKLLNEYLSGTCTIVLDHGGTIDKIVGDALHVIFNAPIDQDDHAARAVNCAVALDRYCEEYRAMKSKQGIEFGETRIGVNTGDAVVGNFGGDERFDYTAHGDAINTAARLESVNKHIGTRICVSETTVRQCPGIRFRPVGKLLLKGKTEALEVFEPVSTTEFTADFAVYNEAYKSLSGEHGLDAFRNLIKDYPKDPVVRFHYERLAAGDSGKTIVMRSK